MPKVKVLNKETAELIAAGEVIERPASIIKELIENAVDSGADNITVEIKNGGISYIRVTDNGCGISYEDVPTAFLRHATSKISEKEDLDNISTLGFRGEALASICAVAKVEIMTKTSELDYGTKYSIEGSFETEYEQCGCPDGTTLIIRDIFFNIPARLKFLKKDVAEGNAIADITTKIALSHPEISFKFIRDNKQEFITPGDGDLYSSVYAVMGKQFAASMIPVEYEINGTKVDGFTVKPLFGRPKRTFQFFFINGRYVKSYACTSALEEAYKNSIMEGKFPACVLRIKIAPSILDVNVHPAKIEVRFTDEHLIHDAIYFSVKNAILLDSAPAEIKLPEVKKTVQDYTNPISFEKPPEYVQTKFSNTTVSEIPNRFVNNPVVETIKFNSNISVEPSRNTIINEKKYESEKIEIQQTEDKEIVEIESLKPAEEISDFKYITQSAVETNLSEKNNINEIIEDEEINQAGIDNNVSFTEKSASEESLSSDKVNEDEQSEIFFRVIGEAFKNYIITEIDDEILFIDKHAAHERIIFEQLRAGLQSLDCQMLMTSEDVMMSIEEVQVLKDNISLAEDLGFAYEIKNQITVSVCGVPTMLDGFNPSDLISEFARNLCENRNNPLPEILDDIYHSIACKAAIKANDINSTVELAEIVRTLLKNESIRYCPHGRPVMFKLTKYELEKQFKRIV